MNKGRASQTRPNFWIKNSLFQKQSHAIHSTGMNYPIGGYERCKHIQPIDRRPTRAETLTEKTLNFATSTRVRARE